MNKEEIDKELEDKLAKNPHPPLSFEHYSYESDCRAEALKKSVALEAEDDEKNKKLYKKIMISVMSVVALIVILVLSVMSAK